jgi:transposase
VRQTPGALSRAKEDLEMLTELSVVEQRYLAVKVLDGAKIIDVATCYGVDRRTIHRWVLRYANEGLEDDGPRTTSAGSAPGPWSFGRWT